MSRSWPLSHTARLCSGSLAGRIGPRVPAHLSAVRMIGALGLALVLLGSGVMWVVVAASVFWMAHFFGMPTQQRMWGIVYPEAVRGRLLSVVSTGRYAAAGFALLFGGYLATEADSALVIAVGGLIGAILALATSRIATSDLGAVEPFSVKRAIHSILDHPKVRQLTMAHALFGGGMATAVPLVTLVMVDRLDLGFASIGITGMAGAAATLVSILVWGAIADRRGTVLVLQAAGILGVAGLALFAVAADHMTVIAASVLVGLSNGAVEVAFALLIANHVPAMHQAAATAGSNAIFGIRGLDRAGDGRGPAPARRSGSRLSAGALRRGRDRRRDPLPARGRRARDRDRLRGPRAQACH